MRATKKSSGTAKSLTNSDGSKYPITIGDIFKTADNSELKKNDLRIREFSIRTDPKDEKSPTIKSKFVPLDIPSSTYKVLIALDKIDAGMKGNNITKGDNQFAFFHNVSKEKRKGSSRF